MDSPMITLLGTIILGFLGSGSLAVWRISRLEHRMDIAYKEAREDRRRLYDKIDISNNQCEKDRRDLAILVGELRGRGYINGPQK